MAEKDWCEETEKEIEKIKKWKTDDRLSLVSKLTFMNGAIASSVQGWHSWLTNAIIMEKFTQQELTDLAKEFEALTVAFLELDIKYTKMLKERKQEEEKTTSYVA